MKICLPGEIYRSCNSQPFLGTRMTAQSEIKNVRAIFSEPLQKFESGQCDPDLTVAFFSALNDVEAMSRREYSKLLSFEECGRLSDLLGAMRAMARAVGMKQKVAV